MPRPRSTPPSPPRPAPLPSAAPTDPAPPPVALALAAHPDDIEFLMGGTLLLLGRAGFELHYLNLASGNCGSMIHPAGRTRRLRRAEAQEAARRLGATWHPSLTDDAEVFYSDSLLRRLAAVMREIEPTLVLTHSPQDYMEDHMNAARLAVTAAFVRGMPNYRTVPARRPTPRPVTVYHALPHGLRDGLRQLVAPGLFVNTAEVQAAKRAALAAHASQKDWLDATQGMESYLRAMDDMARAVGRMSRRFTHAEGWRRHSHLGFCGEHDDPLRAAVGAAAYVNPAYERGLDRPNPA